MFNTKLIALGASTLVTLAGLAGTQAAQEETLRRTLQWPAGATGRIFELSNLHGSVHIVAEPRSDVSVVATRTVQRQRGTDPGPTVDFRSQDNRVLVCGDGTRCGCNVEWPRDRWHDARIRVRVDFEVRVPKGVTLDVCAVNGGTLRVEGSEGRYTLRNVNGAVQMIGVRGAGRASTVNGNLEATFVAPPEASSAFSTVNGRVDVTIPASLSADLRLKTMNGGLYTDFDTTPLPTRAATAERRNGTFVYRSDRFAAVRVGKGGPELTFETLNGDVQVRKR